MVAVNTLELRDFFYHYQAFLLAGKKKNYIFKNDTINSLENRLSQLSLLDILPENFTTHA